MHRLAFLTLALTTTLFARVDHVDIASRTSYLGGKSFGLAGAYERIQGRAFFVVDPANAHDRVIVDLDKAPPNARGEVEFSADIDILVPKNPARGNGALFINVPNRGGRFFIREQNVDEYYLRQGYTLMEVGWQFDVRPDPKLLRLYAPVVRGITGRVRADFVVAGKTLDHTLGHVITGNVGGTGYPVADIAAKDAVLTERDAPLAQRVTIPAQRWRFPDAYTIHLDDGFTPGRIYEVIYTAKDPAVVGCGLAAVRDVAAYVKHDPQAIVHAERAYAMGISQTGRFLRHLVWQGFNADEEGRQVFDALLVYVAGAGRGSFNHRFAQPSRDAQPLSPLFYPTDVFPFTDNPETDPRTGVTAGLLDRARAEHVVPKIFYVNTAYEYWSRGGSLIHTTPDGKFDAEIPPEVRVYFVAGVAHIGGAFPPSHNTEVSILGQQLDNPLRIEQLRHGFAAALDLWANEHIAPPDSRYPRIGLGTLVPVSTLAVKTIRGVDVPHFNYEVYRTDLGPDWSHGIVTEPPRVDGVYPSLVPQINSDGLDMAGVHLPEIDVPLATTTGWNRRDPKIGFPDSRASFVGSYIPWPKADLIERYHNRDEYLGRFTRAALERAHDRFLVVDDLPAVIQRGGEEWDLANRE
ncbi:MAG TPA: alpha/beta hydrolase domain-containing protein [Thermoanaerobaculia bacterium]|nr:alpha/beta hydrolase domain-containing protein [Thermoanaerobaculia bacterium]